MQQDNIDQGTSIAYVGVVILSAIVLASTFLMAPVGQKVYIKPDLTLNADTIYTEDSRWYYSGDSTSKNIRIALYKDKGFTPYDVLYLVPDDYVDVRLEEGYNTVVIRTLEKEYFGTKIRSRILQLKPKPIPKPKFSFKRFFE